MPKISKARIVNFNYNDGNRLIADELFDFSNEKDDDALNVLINLANGGGKSVLVQLMMQPIIPKAKVAGRKIESFFAKLSDHCFVVLEWLKDDSKEKLLTGIAMAAREISSTEDETSGGMAVKYYTFYANYASDASEYSLVNLPLSRNENGRFLPAEYESIKKLSRKNRSQLTYYSSDDNPQWQRKLEEYGLFQDEWRMMEKLNSEEGGLGKFFGDFKTSDQLIDRLLIPTIEGKLKIAHSKEDSSLATMLISYAKQYAGQKNKVREKQEYESFLRALEVLKPLAENLGNQFYSHEESSKMLFGLSTALKKEGLSLQEKRNGIEENLSRLEEQITRIRWEEKSEEYYRCQEAFQEAERIWKSLKEQTDNLQRELDHTSRELMIQECADYRQQLCQHESSIMQLNHTLVQKEQGAAVSNEIAVLGHSAACAIEEKLQQVQPELEAARGEADALDDQIGEEKRLAAKIRENVASAQSSYDQLKGRLLSAEAETDQEMENLQADISRRLDGSYAVEEMDELQQKILADQAQQSGYLNQTEEKFKKILARMEKIPQELATYCREIHDAQQQQEGLESEFERFQKQEQQVKAICDEHNLDFSRRFTDGISEFLLGEQQRSTAQYGDILRRLSLSEEEIDAAKSGFLHVPRGVIEYLNSTGVTYSTCEKYLLDLVQTGKLTGGACLELLKKYPAAAYGVLMREDQVEKFFSFERERWLPAMIPIFTLRQMEAILRNGKTFSGAIAFYAENYFADREHYIAHLTQKQQELLEYKGLEERRKDHIQSQLDVMKAFSYSPDWEQQQVQKIAAAVDYLKKLEAKQQKLEQEKLALQQEKQKLPEKISGYREQLRMLDNRLSCLQRVRARLKAELELIAEIADQKTKLSERKEELQRAEYLLSKQQEEYSDIGRRIEELEKQIEQLRDAYTEVRGKQASQRLQGSWEELLQRYRICIQNENAELSGLRNQLKSEQDQVRNCQKEIKKRGLPEDAYLEVTYSEDRENDLRRKQRELAARMPEQLQNTETAAVAKGQAEGQLRSAQKELSGYGNPLEKSQIGTDFAERTRSCQEAQKEQGNLNRQYMAEERNLDREQGKLANYLERYDTPEQIPDVLLEKQYSKQCAEALAAHRQGEKAIRQAEKEVSGQLSRMSADVAEEMPVIRTAIAGMRELLTNQLQGDRYFTLSIQIDGQMENTARAISQIATDLKEFENFRSDLVRQCTLQGKQIYDGLRQMEASSRVAIYDGKPKQRMIQFDFPDGLDPAISEAAIAEEIDQGTRELAEKLAEEESTEAEWKRYAEKIVGSKSLLRKYLGKEFIQVKAYKIDQNPENSGYRKWKDTQINNSGAEKFVVYFAVILSMINYTRGSLGGIQDKQLCSVLILDNPFGATTSRHILMPMFAIAKHFRVQMICLSDINKTDVINCFDIVIKAIVKKRPMSNREILTHEGNEQLEHGFYRAEQMSLL